MNCLIVDDHPLSIFALGKILESRFPHWNIFKANGIQEAIDCITEQRIPLILLDLILENESGLTLLTYLQKISASYPTQCIIVSNIDDPEVIDTCKRLGARGYVNKKDAFRSIFSAIEDVTSAPMALRKEEGSCDQETFGNSSPVQFTQRQRDIIDLLLKGYSNKTIAHVLNLSHGTVKNYMFHLMRRMSANSRLEMAIKLQQEGYVPENFPQRENRFGMH